MPLKPTKRFLADTKAKEGGNRIMSKKNKKDIAVPPVNDAEIKLDIPEDEIWTYQVPGLAAPHINKPYKHFALKKFIFIITIVIAVLLSCYFSILAIANKDTYQYEDTGSGTYRLTKFSNTGEITELNDREISIPISKRVVLSLHLEMERTISIWILEISRPATSL